MLRKRLYRVTTSFTDNRKDSIVHRRARSAGAAERLVAAEHAYVTRTPIIDIYADEVKLVNG